MDTYLNEVVRYLAAQSWQIAMVTVGVAAGTFAVRHRSAHIRYLLWLLVVAKCLVPPLQTMPLRVLPPAMPQEVPSALSPLWWSGERPTSAPLAGPTPLPAESAPPPTAPPSTVHRLSPGTWLGILWITGAGTYLLMNLLRALRGQHWLRRTRRPLPLQVQADAANLLPAYGLRRGPRLWMLEGVGQPFVWGLVRGSIYVPPGFLTINKPEHRRDILAHELGHVLRYDAAVNTLQVIAQGLFWFHPLVWWANRKIRQEREKCCDEMAVAHLGTQPKDYSTAIVSALIQAQESTRPVPSLAVAGPVKNLEERIKTMLKPGKRFYKRPSLAVFVTVALAAFLTVPTALVLTARAQTQVLKAQAQATSSLHEAAAAGDKEQVQKLLSQGADVNARDKNGNTPLHYAARNWDIKKDFLDFLIAKGADVNARNDDGQTPLHLAIQVVRKTAVATANTANILLSNGAQIDAKDKNGCTPLYVASGIGRTNTVEVLLGKGAKIDEKTNDGLTPLHRAAMLGRAETAEILLRWMGRGNEALRDSSGAPLRYGSVLDSKDVRGYTPLHYAAMAGANDTVERLISNDADVNPKNVRGETPAHAAVLHNHKDTVKLLISKGAAVSSIQVAAFVGDLAKVRSLLEKGISVEAQDGSGLTPLHAAAGAGRREIVEFLIGQGASVNAGAVAEGPGTPLHYAIDGGSSEVTELLLNKGARINEGNKSGMTPLHLAATGNNKDLVKLLLANKADVNAKDNLGETPLHRAAWNKEKDIAKLLIEKGADLSVMSERTKATPLLYAARAGSRDVTKLLIDKGTPLANLDVLLYCMCMHGHRDLAEFFIEKGADANTEAWGYAPSLEAVWNNRPECLRLLLDKGANPNARDQDGWSLLHYTVDPLCRSLEMTRMLLDKGANPNIKLRDDGSSPFEWAAYYGLKETVELFLAKGADVNAEDKKGHTALSEAKQYGHDETVELLRQHGAKE